MILHLGQIFLTDGLTRITSYNVCYTKLLRMLLGSARLHFSHGENLEMLRREAGEFVRCRLKC